MATTMNKQKTPNEITRKDPPFAAPMDLSALMRNMQSEFDQMFDRLAKNFPLAIEDYGRDWSWKINVDDRDDSFVLRADAPGFEASDFDVRICGDRLILQANHKSEKKEKGDEYQESKRCYESLTLPPGVEADKIDAKYQDGVLTVTIPKNAEGRGKKIEVKKQ